MTNSNKGSMRSSSSCEYSVPSSNQLNLDHPFSSPAPTVGRKGDWISTSLPSFWFCSLAQASCTYSGWTWVLSDSLQAWTSCNWLYSGASCRLRLASVSRSYCWSGCSAPSSINESSWELARQSERPRRKKTFFMSLKIMLEL